MYLDASSASIGTPALSDKCSDNAYDTQDQDTGGKAWPGWP
jgi:hypothetical protein